VVWLVFWFRPATIGFALAAASLIGAAVVFEASRSIIVYLLIGLALIAACRLRLPTLVSACLVAGSLVGLVALSRYWAPRNGAGNAASALMSHNLEGLANPLDARTSTLGLHIDMAGEGLRSPLRYPLGRGPALVTLAQSKFGGVSGSSDGVGSTEADPSNIAVALGVPGLVLYLLVVVLGFRGAYHLASDGRDPVAVACLAVLGVTLFQWFNGGQYAVAVLPWLALGYVDASLSRDRGLARAAAEAAPAREPPSDEQTGDR
jgi:hypothetical protein